VSERNSVKRCETIKLHHRQAGCPQGCADYGTSTSARRTTAPAISAFHTDARKPSLLKSGKINRDTLSDWAVWSVVEQSSKQIGIENFGAHDLRRTCAKLCRKNGGDLEQIKILLGHSSIQTIERYLGSEQDIEITVNDNLGL
jgi:integrase